jgi:hypothetical protein
MWRCGNSHLAIISRSFMRTTATGRELTPSNRPLAENHIINCAKTVGAEYIITRDLGDFVQSSIPAISPEGFLEFIEKPLLIVRC